MQLVASTAEPGSGDVVFLAIAREEVIESTNADADRHGLPLRRYPELLMAQFDVYRLAGGELAIDVQTTLIFDFNSRVVIPLLRPRDAPVAHHRLNPTIAIEGERFVVVTQFIIAADRAEPSAPVGNAAVHCDRIKDAYDMLFNGF